ncbi:transposase family protein, partial [Brevibacterium senegalense]|uniref:transposase family protein n=1 Tax=Brevibacterium senegalense TaxID=1033736 RepID=UPI0003767E55
MQSTSPVAPCPVADVICRTLELGIHITGARITDEDVTVIEAAPREPFGFCPDCGAEGRLRDHVIRKLTDVPITGHPTRLHVRLPRYQCVLAGCRRTIFQHHLDAAEPGAKTTKRATTWILKRLVRDQMSISAISRALGLGWDLVNQLATTAAKSLVYADPMHLAGVRVLGIDEHCWKHVRGQGDDSFATIFVDLTPLIDGTGRARLLDV